MKLGEIVDDSIIENKEKTKCYWERLMSANSEANNVSPGARRQATPKDGPKIVEAVAKKLMQRNDGTPKARSGVIEREIQMQRERELAFAREREETRSKLEKSATRTTNSGDETDGSPRLTDQDEMLVLSIPTTDDGNYSEYGSEDKEDSSPYETSGRCNSTPRHQRTRSLDSVSSGHSSASGSGSASLEPCFRRRPVTVKPLDEPDEKSLSQFIRNEKETPIEKEIRLSREREDELRREKGVSPPVDRPKPKSKDEQSDQTVIIERRSSCDVKHSTTVVADVSYRRRKTLPAGDPSKSGAKGGAVPKLFSPNPNQKGLMKRFIASRGKLTPTFALSPPSTIVGLERRTAIENHVAPLERPMWTPTKTENNTTNERRDAVLLGTRPGYVSAEDKIQVELKEMRRREEELRRQQMARSQPDLLCLFDKEHNGTEGEEDEERPPLRSTLSNPNLLDIDDKPLDERSKVIRRSTLIDVWENMIQKN